MTTPTKRSLTPPPGETPGGYLPNSVHHLPPHNQYQQHESNRSHSIPSQQNLAPINPPPSSRLRPVTHSLPNPPTPPKVHEWVLVAPAVDPTMQSVCRTESLASIAAGPVAKGALLDETGALGERIEESEVVSRSVYPALLPPAAGAPWIPPEGRSLLQTIPAPELPPPPAVAKRRWHGWLQALQTASWLRVYLKTTYSTQYDTFSHDPEIVPVLARAIMELAGAAVLLLAEDPVLLQIQSPVYILGDIHGNFGDLDYFLSRTLAFYEPAYTPASFLFLGDYVDRGRWSVEVAALLLSLKVLAPRQFYLLRGNHEVRAVNGDIAEYGTASFKHQCYELFGEANGEDVYQAFNNAFLQMPLAAIIDGHVFCTHGGIPRPMGYTSSGADLRIEMLRDPRFPRFNTTSLTKEHDDNETMAKQRQIMTDLLWADPAEGDQEQYLDDDGFGPSERSQEKLRCFGNKAIDTFFEKNGFTFMIRAHQHKYMGFRKSKV